MQEDCGVPTGMAEIQKFTRGNERNGNKLWGSDGHKRCLSLKSHFCLTAAVIALTISTPTFCLYCKPIGVLTAILWLKVIALAMHIVKEKFDVGDRNASSRPGLGWDQRL